MNPVLTALVGLTICAPAMAQTPRVPVFDGVTITGTATSTFPTPTAGDNSQKPATTGFVGTAVSVVGAAAAAAQATANAAATPANVTAAVATETTRATGAEGTNATAIGAETTRATGVEATKAATTALTTEATTARAAEAAAQATANAALPLAGGILTGNLKLPSVNLWAPQFGLSDSTTGTPFTAGTGYAVGEVLTLNDACATHGTVVVNSVTSGGITSFNIIKRGICLVVPANPVSVLSTSGAGAGAAFTATYGPLSAGLLYGTLTNNGGNLFLGGEAPGNIAGGENVLVGDRTGGSAAVMNFTVAMGHNALGIGTSCASPVIYASTTAIGTDAARNSCGLASTTLFGAGVLKSYTGSNTSTHAAFGSSGFGYNALYYWNGGDFAFNTALGSSACQGASTGAVTFTNGTCVGTNTGSQLTTATNFLIMAGGGNGNVGSATFASGYNVLLIGSGGKVVDTTTASANNYVNIENSIIVSTSTPGWGSGFGSNAGAPGTSTSASFRYNVGTGGSATTGVITFSAAAPTGWACTAVDTTTPAANNTVITPLSPTSVTATNYSRTSGAVAAWTSGDQLLVNCNGF